MGDFTSFAGTEEPNKMSRNEGDTILQQFTRIFDEDGIPLFVSEGTSEDKMRVIEGSDYLSFAYREFANDHQPLVVFGSAFAVAHITRAMTSAPWPRKVAVSIKANSPEEAVSEKLRVHKAVADHSAESGSKPDVLFFDSTTHPLGDPGLQVGSF
jgi:hypothetical protein